MNIFLGMKVKAWNSESFFTANKKVFVVGFKYNMPLAGHMAMINTIINILINEVFINKHMHHQNHQDQLNFHYG